MRQRRLDPGDQRSIRRSVGVPVLRFRAERKVRSKEVRLVEVEADAAIERRPTAVRAGGTRTAKEVHVMDLGVDPALLLGAVSNAEVHTLVLSLGHGDARVDHRTLLLG